MQNLECTSSLPVYYTSMSQPLISLHIYSLKVVDEEMSVLSAMHIFASNNYFHLRAIQRHSVLLFNRMRVDLSQFQALRFLI